MRIVDFCERCEIVFSLQRALEAIRVILRFSTPKKLINLLKCYKELLLSQEKLDSYPFVAIVEPTNACNLRCPYCATGSGKFDMPPASLSLNDFKAIVDRLGAYLYLIPLFIGGEPFLNKETLSMVRYARDRKIASLIHTNFNITMDSDMACQIVNSGLTYLSVSVDGATQDSFRKYRKGGDLNLVLRNIDLLNDAKQKLNSKEPVMIWQYLLFKHNEHELMQAGEMARGKHMKFRVLTPQCPPEFKPVRQTKGHPFMKRGKCKFLWTTLFITSQMIALPCCQAYSEKYNFGRIDLRNFHNLWNNPIYVKTRRWFNREGDDVSDEFKYLCYQCKNNILV